jgi:hypothetical protein
MNWTQIHAYNSEISNFPELLIQDQDFFFIFIIYFYDVNCVRNWMERTDKRNVVLLLHMLYFI